MSNIKNYEPIDEALFNAIELHYKAADALDHVLEASLEVDPKLHAFIEVLQSQSKRLAGKLKKVRVEYLGKEKAHVKEQ